MGLLDFKRGRTIDDVGAQAGSNGSSSIKIDPAWQLGRILLDAIESIVEEILRRQTEKGDEVVIKTADDSRDGEQETKKPEGSK